MKNLYILSLALLFGCGNKNVLLVNQVPVSTVVNPSTSAIIKNNTLVYVRLDNGGAIHGLTTSSAFSTVDYFTDFSLAPISKTPVANPNSFSGNQFVYATGQGLASIINYSADYGNDWNSFSPVFSPALSSTGFYSSGLSALSVAGSSNILALYVQQSYLNGNLRQLYKIDPSTKKAVLVFGSQDAYLPKAMQFADGKTGWMLLSNAGSWLTGTSDSGVTWTKPILINNASLSNLRVSGSGQLAVFASAGNGFFSGDNGVTWKKAPDSLRFADISIVGASVLYGLTDAGLKKSTDGGATWDVVSYFGASFNNVQHLFFEDELNGLAYSDQRLFITADGGKSWKTLLYPYAYITQ